MKVNKAQQEIIGFVIIVLIVVIVGVIFLGISLQKDSGIETTDAEISNFLITTMRYTSNCSKDFEADYRTISGLISATYDGRSCLDGRKAEDVLKQELTKILDSLWTAGEEYKTKYYKLTIYFQTDTRDPNTRQEPKIVIENGNADLCAVRRAGQYSIDDPPGAIITRLEICKEAE